MSTFSLKKLKQLIAKGETLTLEFKSDEKPLPDRELISTVVSLANTNGGDLLLGVEDDGRITGLHQNHLNTTGLAALIANKTNPSLSVQVLTVESKKCKVARIIVPKSKRLVATSEGLLQRRRLMADGKPQTVPFYPHEFLQRQSGMNLTDPSAILIPEVKVDDLSTVERGRIREAIRRYGGDTSLLPLDNNEFDRALGFVTNEGEKAFVTLAGLLFLGREDLLRKYVPTYEVAFQVLEGTDVRINEFFRKPLLHVFEEIEQLFMARVHDENEFQSGLFRVSVPNYDMRAFREAFVNALVHRDYSYLGAVHVRIGDDGLTISNPGSFVEGVTLKNLLVTEPRPRNPLLADIAKRIGLAERTGRGIDRIYEGLLRYGRPAPDYSRTNSNSVVVRMSNANTDIPFLELILQEEQRIERSLPIDSLIILARLREECRVNLNSLSLSIQKPDFEARKIVENLVEEGIVESYGSYRSRTYTLSAKLYRKSGKKAGYVRQAGFDLIQQEQMILTYIEKNKAIKRAEVADLCKISPYQASRILKKLSDEKKIVSNGKGKGTYYERRI